MPDWLGWIPSIFSWVVRQGRVIVVLSLYMAVFVVLIRAFQSALEADTDSTNAYLFFSFGFVLLLPLPQVLKMFLDAETRQKRDELEYRRRQEESEDD